MARIPEEELTRLKRDVSVKDLVEARGVQLKRHGADWIGLCPFHEDREPSLVVSPRKNLWHCLGACQTGGSVIDWVMRSEGVSFRHAVELLRAGGKLEGSEWAGRAAKKTTRTKLETPFEARAAEVELLGQVVEFYHEALKQSPQALAYLEQRGLRSSEVVERFKLGYADRTLGYRLPKANRQEGAELRGRLKELGILRKSGHEHFRGSLVIPIFDAQGQVVQMYGRKIRDDLRSGTPKHLYLPGPHAGVFNAEALKASEEIILCESLIDALTFWCAGYRNVTASYGVEGFTKEHLEAFERCGVRRVLVAYDSDEAGDRAAEKLAARLGERGLHCFRVQFPRGMDANEYALKVPPAESCLGRSIRHVLWMGEGPAPERRLRMPPANGERPSAGEAAKRGKADAGPDAAPTPVLVPENDQAQVPTLLAADADATETAQDRATPATPGQAIEPNHQQPAAGPGDEVELRFGDRRYRVRGLAKNQSPEVLKVNLLAGRGEDFHVDTLDLYAARPRGAFIKAAATELTVEERVVKKDLGRVLLALEELQSTRLEEALESKPQKIELSEQEREAALGLLRDPRLLERILTDFDVCGVVGEQTNKLVGYLAAVSRKLEEPLAVIVQSSSAAGKTSLMEAVLAFVPEEERVKYSAMTGQSLFYMGEQDLRHKILAVVEEEGAERASYALKLLQSEQELAIASTGKDPDTGRLVTHEYRVEGPVMILLTTTAVEIEEELLNRCIVLTVDEEREQTKKIHAQQRLGQTLGGLLAKQSASRVLKVHQDAQRLLEPVLVVNPYAERLTFLDDRTRTRRDHMKYLTLIRSIALLHQHQRSVKTIEHEGRSVEYIEVSVEDIEVANRLAHQVLGRSLDELSPQSRRLLQQLDRLVAEACERLGLERMDYRFTRREVREHTGWSYEQVRVHLERLVEMEYVLVHHGSRGQQFVYELLYDGKGEEGQPFLMGLIEVEGLVDGGTAGALGGAKGGFGGGLGVHTGPIPAHTGVPITTPRAEDDDENPPSSKPDPENALKGPKEPERSYVLVDPSPAGGAAMSAKGRGR